MMIDDCLAAFTVAATANLPDAVETARLEVGRLLVAAPNEPTHQLAILCELKAAFDALQIDSSAGREIARDMDERIAGLRASL
ncbi:hypothetical protein [Chelatococcus sambhunathii]|nr:hypothetical protein [Chelatococcus sambhunathii]